MGLIGSMYSPLGCFAVHAAVLQVLRMKCVPAGKAFDALLVRVRLECEPELCDGDEPCDDEPWLDPLDFACAGLTASNAATATAVSGRYDFIQVMMFPRRSAAHSAAMVSPFSFAFAAARAVGSVSATVRCSRISASRFS